MKTIKTKDGSLVLPAFEFADLRGKARQKAIDDHYEFLMQSDEEQDAEYSENDVIENIEINQYLFDMNGRIIHLTYYVDGHVRAGEIDLHLFDKEVPCEVA